MSIHNYYLRLDDSKRLLVDDIAQTMIDKTQEAGYVADCADNCEVVVEAIAKWIYEANVS